jgi:hypothetical protein
VALQHRRVHEARAVADLDLVVVEQHRLIRQWVLGLRREQANVAVDPVPVAGIDDHAGRRPARGAIEELAADRIRPHEPARAVTDAAEHPAEAELLGSHAVGAAHRQPSVLPLDVDEREAGLDAQGHQRLLPERADAVGGSGLEHRVEHGDCALGPDRDLEAEVSGIAGARQSHRRVGHLGGHMLEVGQRLGLGHQGSEHGPRARPLDGEHPVVAGHVLEVHPQTGRQLLEPRERGPAGGEQELVCGVTERHAVVHHESAVVAPGRVLRLPRPTGADVPHQRAGQEALGVRTGDPVLVQRRGVEDADRVADREVLVLRRMGVAQRRQLALPVGVETLAVELAQARMERRGRDHRCPG